MGVKILKVQITEPKNKRSLGCVLVSNVGL